MPPGEAWWAPEKTLSPGGSLGARKINLSSHSLPLLQPFIPSWGTSSHPPSLLLIKACLQEGADEMMETFPLTVNDQPGLCTDLPEGCACLQEATSASVALEQKNKNKNRPSIGGTYVESSP